MQKDVILTEEGLEKLKDELEHLSGDKRREVAERIKEAREFGDISENSEYDDAKNEQAMLEARIAQLEERCARARCSTPAELGTDVVRVGSIVHVKDDKTASQSPRSSARPRPPARAAVQRVAGRQGPDGPQEGRDVDGRRCPSGKKRKLKITKIDVGGAR